jgi:hypothetical protein
VAVSVTINITKTVVEANKYDVSMTVAAATNIDRSIFVLDFPDLKFHQVANPYAIVNYPVYNPSSPPPARTKYVRVNTVTITFPDPTNAVAGIATVKSNLKTLCTDWNGYNTGFAGNEEYTASVV